MTHIQKQPPLGHLDLIEDFIESLEKSSPPPVTPEDGKNAIELLNAYRNH